MFEIMVALLMLGLAIWFMLPEEDSPRPQKQLNSSSRPVTSSKETSGLPREEAEKWMNSRRG
ncbi:MAG: hypothetical protein OET90_06105 [Desulfuromonadales bacterium]|nr:hypothetical protein [Desulfuromonadales bacterium]